MTGGQPYEVVRAHNPQNPTCNHPECVELRRIRREAFTLGLMGIVNRTEVELGRCPENRRKP